MTGLASIDLRRAIEATRTARDSAAAAARQCKETGDNAEAYALDLVAADLDNALARLKLIETPPPPKPVLG